MEDKIQDYLNGMRDVASVIQSVLDSSYVSTSLTPEPLHRFMKRQVNHMNIMMSLDCMKNENFSEFENIMMLANQWLSENTD